MSEKLKNLEIELYAYRKDNDFKWFEAAVFKGKDEMSPQQLADLANTVVKVCIDMGKKNLEELVKAKTKNG